MRESIGKHLQLIPGVGEKTAKDLWNLGYRYPRELKDHDPDELYLRLCDIKGRCVDRCVLYVFRCAVYFASTNVLDPELLKWWNWTDKKCGLEKTSTV
ncbi:helix-hairpin-helix domain-containing protein [candidate division WOR-3 bacterium]|nr:helix-hairpin-helix domain-containing protein [candidate division WOR-3 bacterium]